MRFYSTSPRVAIFQSIYRRGIDPAFARGPIAQCWFCANSKRKWAIEHVAERHGVDPRDVIVVRVQVARHLLTHRGKGLWTCDRVVKGIRSVAVTTFAA